MELSIKESFVSQIPNHMDGEYRTSQATFNSGSNVQSLDTLGTSLRTQVIILPHCEQSV